MKLKMSISAIVLLLCGTILYAQETIQLLVGEQRTIDIGRAGDVDVFSGNPNIANVRLHPNRSQVILTGISEGSTVMTIRNLTFNTEKVINVRVVMRDPDTIIKEIKLLFGEVDYIKFENKASRVVATGEIKYLPDRKKFDQILELYPEILNLAADKSEQRMVGVAVSVIEVSVSTLTDYNPLESNTNISVYSNLEADPQKPTNPWPTSPFWYWEATTDIFSKLAYWVTKGKAKYVANPIFIISDGDSAIFHSGGEIPFEIQSGFGISIEWKKYGIIIRVKPRYLESGSIYMELDAEASNLDRSYVTRQLGVPSVITRKIKNNVTVKRDETVVLAGIYNLQETESVKRVPILGHILPFFFSSVNKNYEKKEIVILVTPTAPPSYKISNFPMAEPEVQKLNTKNE